MSKMNSFECPRCLQFTRHIKISYREMVALNNAFNKKKYGDNHENWVDIPLDVLGTAHDVLGLTKLQSIAGLEYWKCCCCGLGTRRRPSGEINCTSEEIDGYDIF